MVSITYLDHSGVRQTVDPDLYIMDADGEPASVVPAHGKTWPNEIWTPGSVQVTYLAGYGNSPASVPAKIQLAMLQLVAHWYENREATVLPESGTGIVDVPKTVDDLLELERFDAFTLES